MFVVGLFIVPSAEFLFFTCDSLNFSASIVHARYYTNQIQSDCFEYPLKFLLKSSCQKCLNIFLIFSKFSYPQRKPVMKNFKAKYSLLHSRLHISVVAEMKYTRMQDTNKQIVLLNIYTRQDRYLLSLKKKTSLFCEKNLTHILFT